MYLNLSFEILCFFLSVILYPEVTIKLIRTVTVIPGLKENQREMEVNNWHKELSYDNWVPITVSGSRPPARYKVYFSLSFSFSYFI